MISLNGSAARRAQLGDLTIIAAFAMVDEAELRAGWAPELVFVDEHNKMKGSRGHVPMQNGPGAGWGPFMPFLAYERGLPAGASLQ